MIKSHTIEMLRSVERVLPGGEREVLSAGQHYTLDDATAAPLLTATKQPREMNGAIELVEVPAAAVIVETYQVPEDEAEMKALADAQAAAPADVVGDLTEEGE